MFGILGTSPAITLRNWLTYVLRFCIHQQENLAYHNKKGLLNELDIKLDYNTRRGHREGTTAAFGLQAQRPLYYTVNEVFVKSFLSND